LKTQAELRAGKYDAVLNNQSLLHLRGEADTEVERLARMAEAQRKEQERQVGKLVSDYKEAALLGFPWRGPVSETRLGELAKGTEHVSDFLNVRAASRVLGLFNQMAPTEQSDYLRAIASGAKTGTEAKFSSTLQAAHEETVSGLKDDPLTFAIKQRVVPDPGPFNPSDPASLKARSLTAGLVAQRYGVPVSPLSDD